MALQLNIQSQSRNQLLDLTDKVEALLQREKWQSGILTVFCPHTTAAVTINENADPAVARDILETLSRLIPANQAHFTHQEGNSDAHLKSSLVGASLQVLVSQGRLILGTWQSIYFAEFDGPRSRQVWISFSPSTAPR
jgi:secondary thiamine-phosphate synthase enzyme